MIQTGATGSANSFCGACESAWTSSTSPATVREDRDGGQPAWPADRSATAASAIQSTETGHHQLSVDPLDASHACESRRGS